MQAIFDREDEGSGWKGLGKRAGYLGRALLYGALTFGTVGLLFGADEDESGGGVVEERQATAQAFDLPAGQWLVGLVGLALIGAALFNAYRAFTQKFEEKWDTVEMGEAERRWGSRVSSAGLLARFVVFGLIGSFLLKAASEHDAQEAIRLDGLLRKVVQADYGPLLSESSPPGSSATRSSASSKRGLAGSS